METPSLIITAWNGDTPTKAMSSACRALFPTIEAKGAEGNKRLLESFFRNTSKRSIRINLAMAKRVRQRSPRCLGCPARRDAKQEKAE